MAIRQAASLTQSNRHHFASMVIITDATSSAAPSPESVESLVSRGLALERGLSGAPADTALAVSLYRRANAAGSARGAYCLAVCYYNGTGVSRNRAEARRLYERAAGGGSGRAAVALGDLEEAAGRGPSALEWFLTAAGEGCAEGMLRAGLLLASEGGGKERERAFELFLLAEERAGERVVRAAARRCVGIGYLDGDGVEKDVERAVWWLEKAVGDGDEPVARFLLGGALKRLGRTVEALMCFEIAGKEGHGGAACAAGRMLEVGAGVEKDYERAVSNFEVAVEAEEADVSAFVRLGDAYECGRGVRVQLERAQEVFERGAEMGSKECALRAARCCSRRDFLCAVPEKAVRFYAMCAQDYPEAAVALGRASRDGWGCRRDGARAMECFEMAGKGCAEGLVEKGVLLMRGMAGVERDVGEANRCFRKAVEAGNGRGVRYLARNYENGTGFGEPDLEAACELYERGVGLGCVKCMARLGLMRLRGTGCTKDERDAFRLFRKAAENGDVRGMRRLAACYEKGRGIEVNLEEAERWRTRVMDVGVGDDDAL